MKKKNIGSSFDSWLREEGIYEEVSANAIKRVLARQVEAAMKEKHFSKAEMARRMHTSRAALDRLLDPEYDAVTLSTLRKAATAVGRELRLELFKKSLIRGCGTYTAHLDADNPFGTMQCIRQRTLRTPELAPPHTTEKQLQGFGKNSQRLSVTGNVSYAKDTARLPAGSPAVSSMDPQEASHYRLDSPALRGSARIA